jgi:hypothetical protein
MLADKTLLRGHEVHRDSLTSLRDWFPVAIDDSNPAQALLYWRYLGRRRLTAAFFEDSFAGQASHERKLCRTPLLACNDLPPAVAPSAFIFHVSRCGSTLLTQMLATLPQCIVASEPPVLDAFFRLHHHHPDRSGGTSIFRHLIAALGQQRSSAESHFFVKFDSWHMPWLPWLRSLFPQTPCVLLYREPAQVLASHRRQRGAHMVPGLVDLSALQLSTAHLLAGDLEGFGELVLAGIFRAAHVAAQGDQPTNMPSNPIILLNYQQLPAVLWTVLFNPLKLQCKPEELATLQARAGWHAKKPDHRFDGDPPANQTGAKALRHPSDVTHMTYLALEQLRAARQRN